MRNIRRVTAERLSAAWTSIPHVTQCDKADITELEKLRQKYAKQAEKAGGKLTITAIALKVIAAALKQFPQFNSSVDMAGQSIVLKKYVHIGVAVDTDRGLIVPVIRDVDQKGIVAARRWSWRSSPRRPRPASWRRPRCRAGRSRSAISAASAAPTSRRSSTRRRWRSSGCRAR